MTILFLDQSGELGGAELCLLDILCQGKRQSQEKLQSKIALAQASLAQAPLAQVSLACNPLAKARVALFSAGPFQACLEQAEIENYLVGDVLTPQRDRSMVRRRLREAFSLMRPLREVLRLAQGCELLYANTPKAMLVGAIVQRLTGLPLVYHLHDILSEEHFGYWEHRLLVRLASKCATRVIVNSAATKGAFVAAGGQASKTTMIHNGFLPEKFEVDGDTTRLLKQTLGLESPENRGEKYFTIGSFSRFAPWKGQSLLLEAIAELADPTVKVLLVGDALFGENAYHLKLRRQTKVLGLESQVQFLGFREDVPQLLSTCDLVVHTPRAPEPFGRVMVEGMLAGKPVIAPQEGSATELICHGRTGWLIPPRDVTALSQAIQQLKADADLRQRLGQAAAVDASQRFHLEHTNRQIDSLCSQLLQPPPRGAPE